MGLAGNQSKQSDLPFPKNCYHDSIEMGTETKPAPGNKPKRFKWTIRLAVVLAVYTVVGFFVVPAIIKSQMLKRLPALSKRQVAVEQVQCNPYALSLTIHGFSLKETNGD